MKQKRWKTDGYLRIFASYYRPHWKLFALDMVCGLCIWPGGTGKKTTVIFLVLK